MNPTNTTKTELTRASDEELTQIEGGYIASGSVLTQQPSTITTKDLPEDPFGKYTVGRYTKV